jgi:hypothetical protein
VEYDTDSKKNSDPRHSLGAEADVNLEEELARPVAERRKSHLNISLRRSQQERAFATVATMRIRWRISSLLHSPVLNLPPTDSSKLQITVHQGAPERHWSSRYEVASKIKLVFPAFGRDAVALEEGGRAVSSANRSTFCLSPIVTPEKPTLFIRVYKIRPGEAKPTRKVKKRLDQSHVTIASNGAVWKTIQSKGKSIQTRKSDLPLVNRNDLR